MRRHCTGVAASNVMSKSREPVFAGCAIIAPAAADGRRSDGFVRFSDSRRIGQRRISRCARSQPSPRKNV
jgi:hypothetical protein